LNRDLPCHIGIYRVHGPGDILIGHPAKHWCGQARGIYFHDLFVRENIVKAGAEMAAGFDYQATQRAKIHAETFDHHGFAALSALADDDHPHSANAKQRAGAQVHLDPLHNTAPAHKAAILQILDHGPANQGFGESGFILAVEGAGELSTDTKSMGSLGTLIAFSVNRRSNSSPAK